MKKPLREPEAFRSIRDLDVIALPLIERYGIAEAYRLAIEAKEAGARKASCEDADGA